MKPCTMAMYISLISRCDSVATVSNTSELLPESETPALFRTLLDNVADHFHPVVQQAFGLSSNWQDRAQ